MPTKPSNSNVVDACARRLRALASYAPKDAVVGINGRAHRLEDVLAIYQDCLDTRSDLATQRAKARAALVAREKAEARRREADHALRHWVEGLFGIGSKEALDFGFAPAKRGELTVEEKARAVALAKATREARHTMGRKERLAIRGRLEAPAAAGGTACPSPEVVTVQHTLIGYGGVDAGGGDASGD